MPIANTPLTATQFDFLQRNVTDQSTQFDEASALAQSGLQYVVDLNDIPPEVDLVNAFANHLISMESLESDSNFTAVVASLNLHAINRGTTAGPTDTFSTRLNTFLSGNSILVTQRYARISSGAGFIIDTGNIEP